MSDLIERQSAIDALKGLPTWWADEGGYYGGVQPPMVALLDPEDAVSAIENLPSAQPERKRGKWTISETAYDDTEAKCSKCGFVTLVNEPGNGLHMLSDLRFCPNCGAKMEGEQ